MLGFVGSKLGFALARLPSLCSMLPFAFAKPGFGVAILAWLGFEILKLGLLGPTLGFGDFAPGFVVSSLGPGGAFLKPWFSKAHQKP